MEKQTVLTDLLDAVMFAAERHRNQRRKDADASPYINHPIALAHLLAGVGRVDDIGVPVENGKNRTLSLRQG